MRGAAAEGLPEVLGYEQPIGGIAQTASIVPDLHAAIARCERDLGASPSSCLPPGAYKIVEAPEVHGAVPNESYDEESEFRGDARRVVDHQPLRNALPRAWAGDQPAAISVRRA